MDYSVGLLIRCTNYCTEGSNPSLSVDILVFFLNLFFYLLVKDVKIDKILKIFKNPAQGRKRQNPLLSYSILHVLDYVLDR